MVRLYLVRHAVAADGDESQPFTDHLRALTEKGRRRFRRSARAFASLGESIDLVCTSPVLRAVQTAEILASSLGHDEVRVLDELQPGAGVPLLLERLSELGTASIVLVGHKRLLCDLAVTLAGLPIEQALRLHLKRGAIARIDVRKLSGHASGEPRWWLAPATDALQDGLPLT
jgi:phosphohistidine phosphatase